MVDTSKWLKYKMGNNSSATVHPNDKRKYAVGKAEREREREKEREEKKERSRQPLTKEQRESKRLAKMAIGAPEKEYEKGVAFNKNPDVTDGWDDVESLLETINEWSDTTGQAPKFMADFSEYF